ncbi:NAD-dependent epimerase/dehydratase family protein [Hymenobacter fodinae]|uniref:SDR family oxidoreductase n=1 Tax=Hymenobacter fodinae TaxID=2510796 RepID=A0A4Z0P6M1_9BACT|nr:NAD-dependent epimerase/dehydratase family protein [Hymenobacter fodinae]TGE07941.1 SDR family oxidoreductase [Hymenobacter fodinae]
MLKVLIIGGSGFVGRHIQEIMAGEVNLFLTSRQEHDSNDTDKGLYFDLAKKETWNNVLKLNPDVIINSAGYGVVKEEVDLETMYGVNYKFPKEFVSYLCTHSIKPFWLQIGTAFEYDLNTQVITEDSPCVPMTHYGMSKYLFSNFLLSSSNTLQFLILRPFAMFGPYETSSKFIPYLLNSQYENRAIELSSGEQKRDYFYVKDLAMFIKNLLQGKFLDLEYNIINVGSGVASSLREIAFNLSKQIPDYKPQLWQWGRIDQRADENSVFYNNSTRAKELNLVLTPVEKAFQDTISYYFK